MKSYSLIAYVSAVITVCFHVQRPHCEVANAKRKEVRVTVKMAMDFRFASPTASMAAALLMLFILQLGVRESAANPPAGTVKITSFSYGGSGCPPGSAEGVVSDDAQAVTLMFSSYHATTDEGLAKRKSSCIVSVGLSYPKGWTVAVGTVTMRGYAKLEYGVNGQIQTWYYFSGLAGTAKLTRKFSSPFDNNFSITDKFLTIVYCKCGLQRNLNLASEAKVTPWKSGRKGFIAVDSKDFSIRQVWNLKWQTC
eukprot:TRINITY_DN1946_c0_g1_i2.p1 TRINITY_DN1946_c0_g1~~TRINITY_DN1946_c0_g1_i2.p1  ORF type:complete len:252 (+),score=40.55 TRINITY_DN1946_c0_g1_i2:120-875(+)